MEHGMDAILGANSEVEQIGAGAALEQFHRLLWAGPPKALEESQGSAQAVYWRNPVPFAPMARTWADQLHGARNCV